MAQRLASQKFLRVLGTILGALLLWHLAAILVSVPYLLPSPISVGMALIRMVSTGQLLNDLRISLTRALIGYSLAALVAIPVGMFVAWWRALDETMGSLLELLRPIPSLALIPLAIIWLGLGEVSKISLIAYACFFSIYINTHAGVKNVDPLYVRVLRVYGNGNRDILTKVIFYSMLPYAFTGLRYSAAISLILLVAVEMVGAQSGLGYFLVKAQTFFLIPEMYAGIVVFGLLGFLANGFVVFLERRVIKWRQAVGAEF